MIQMETMMMELRSENANLQQQLLQTQSQIGGAASSTAPTGSSMQMERLIGLLTEQVKVLSERSRPSLVDVKGVGKPTVFQNSEAKFHEWARKTEDYLIGVQGNLEEMLEWALEQDAEISLTNVADKFGINADPTEQVDGCSQINVQLKTVLAHLCEGESWSIVQNCGRNGLEAWRRLHRRFDPLTGGRRRNLLRAIMAPQRVKMEELGSALQVWEDMVARYNKKNSKIGDPELADDIKCSAVEAMVPESLERHLQLNAMRLKRYEDVRMEVYSYFEACTGKVARPSVREQVRDEQQSTPMDVDSLMKGKSKGKGRGKGDGKHGKGTGKGKGTGSKFDGNCNFCGKYGHRASECWSKQSQDKSGKGQEKGGKGKSKNGKGKHAGALDEPEAQEGTSANVAGSLELGSLGSLAGPSCQSGCGHLRATGIEVIQGIDKYAVDGYVKMNFDTGAAVTAFPLDAAPSGTSPSPSAENRGYVTASGEKIPDHGGAKLACKDENGLGRTISGRYTKVHKILVSAAQVCRKQFVWLDGAGGYVIPQDGPIGKAMQAELDRLMRKYGHETLLPMYQEKGVYNIYLDVKGQSPLAAVSAENGTRASPLPQPQETIEDLRKEIARSNIKIKEMAEKLKEQQHQPFGRQGARP